MACLKVESSRKYVKVEHVISPFVMPHIIKASSIDSYWNHNCQLPYGLTADHVRLAVKDVYDFFYQINSLLVGRLALDFFESLVLGNTLSGVVSELLVKRIAIHSEELVRNVRVGGHPDLIPKGRYPHDSVLRGNGIEVKTSIQRGGWQGHNPETCWLMVFRYVLGEPNHSPQERQPVRFVQILAGHLRAKDWSLAERSKSSRRTRTTSINERGMRKLRQNPVYQDPAYIVAPNSELRSRYMELNRYFTKV